MGQWLCNVDYRGDVDYALEDSIKVLSEEEFQNFLLMAEDKGILDHTDYPEKQNLLDDLCKKNKHGEPIFERALKLQVVNNIVRGKAYDPFYISDSE